MRKLTHGLIVLLLLLSAQTHASHKYLSVGWELWYPYQYHNQNQQLVGLDFDIFNAIVKQAGFKVVYTELPWKRHLHYIKTGEMDVAMGASHTLDRENYAYFTEPYRLELVKLYVRKGAVDKIHLHTLEDLIQSNYMIGVEGGYYYGKQYQELIKKPEFQAHINEVIDLEQNIELLMKGHLDGLLVDPVTMKAFVDKYKLQGEFEPHPVTIYQDDIHIMLSKKSVSKETLELFNQAIKSLKKNGTIEAISAQWSTLQRD